ncbi:MAG: YceI family protein [Sulfuritalea sp.]|nr:YceI family protein [Sulfuritalea sp.]
MKKALFVAVLSAVSAAALAAPESFAIDAGHTLPRFEYNHLGYSFQQHRFDKTSGRIVLDRAAKTGSVDVTIDAKSVNTGLTLFNQHIQAEDFFHTEKYPTISFKSTAVRFDGDKPVAIDGNLTIKGVTRLVTLTVTHFHAMPHPMLKKDAIGANAVAKLKRSEFNMPKNVPYVSDEITLSIAVEAVKE